MRGCLTNIPRVDAMQRLGDFIEFSLCAVVGGLIRFGESRT